MAYSKSRRKTRSEFVWYTYAIRRDPKVNKMHIFKEGFAWRLTWPTPNRGGKLEVSLCGPPMYFEGIQKSIRCIFKIFIGNILL